MAEGLRTEQEHMSRAATPFDNASCESFIMTLKREEIYANECENMEHMRDNIEGVYRALLQPEAAALSVGLPVAGGI